jgi:peptidase E
VGGGNTAHLLAIWRVHGLDVLLRDAWLRGAVLAGISAGMLCWLRGGVTDSFGGLEALTDGLGLIEGSACPHYDGERERRPTLHRLIREGLPGGWAADDGAALHFHGTELVEAVGSRPGAGAYRVELVEGQVVERRLPVRFLGAAHVAPPARANDRRG